MLVDPRGPAPLPALIVSIAQVSGGVVICDRRPSYQTMLGRKNPLSSKGTAA